MPDLPNDGGVMGILDRKTNWLGDVGALVRGSVLQGKAK